MIALGEIYLNWDMQSNIWALACMVSLVIECIDIDLIFACLKRFMRSNHHWVPILLRRRCKQCDRHDGMNGWRRTTLLGFVWTSNEYLKDQGVPVFFFGLAKLIYLNTSFQRGRPCNRPTPKHACFRSSRVAFCLSSDRN